MGSFALFVWLGVKSRVRRDVEKAEKAARGEIPAGGGVFAGIFSNDVIIIRFERSMGAQEIGVGGKSELLVSYS